MYFTDKKKQKSKQLFSGYKHQKYKKCLRFNFGNYLIILQRKQVFWN